MVGHKSRWVFFDLIQLKFTEAKIAAPWGGGMGSERSAALLTLLQGTGATSSPTGLALPAQQAA